MVSEPALALGQLREIIRIQPDLAEAHRLSALALHGLGRHMEAQEADLQAARLAIHDEVLIRAGGAMVDNELHVAERLLKGRLREQPTDIAAIRMLAELAARVGRPADSENLLRRALELAPGYGVARANLATLLYKQGRFTEALRELDRVLEHEPGDVASTNLKASALGRTGGFEEAIALYEDLVRRAPGDPRLHMNHGHMLKTVGRQEDAVSAYRQAIAHAAGLGEAWWSLANLKTFRFDEADIGAMETALESTRLPNEDRFQLHFALGKAHEDRSDWAASFEHYQEGNRLRRSDLDYDPNDLTAHVDKVLQVFTPEFLDRRKGWGHAAGDPLFVLGMPRAGSTLIEQILASHSQVEGTMELPDIPAIASEAAHDAGADTSSWAEVIDGFAPERLEALGAEYIARTRVQRKSGKPFFIDKMPNNWLHVGFIHLILPNARIIDARRHPMDCCLSNFRQHFARGQAFSYDLGWMGRYYADYVRHMRHWDRVMPGRVYRLCHEELIDDPEREIRRLLEHLGLPFEEACLSFHRNSRAVRTASSEQVRRPINREGMDRWRHYARWLGPLREGLGKAAESWRD
ncbi:MAG: sulfotransferase [Sphingobium sp.]